MFDHFVGLALKGLEIQRSYLRCITANKYLHLCELLEVIKSSSVTFSWSNVSFVCLFSVQTEKEHFFSLIFAFDKWINIRNFS